MRQPCVYDLLRAQKGDRQVARLLASLDELAGRLEIAGGCSAAAAKRGSGVPAAVLAALELPNPSGGALPLFAGASEHEALQEAAAASAAELHGRAKRETWRSWLMDPRHAHLVVSAAWLLLALSLRQQDPQAGPLTAHVFEQLKADHMAGALVGHAAPHCACELWPRALADASCRLLRRAFPGAAELDDPELQAMLHRQLRLWTTGLLPSDLEAVTPAGPAAGDGAAAGAVGASDGAASGESAEGSAAAAAAAATPSAALASGCRSVSRAAFHSAKPSPLVSSFMADRGLRPDQLRQATGLPHLQPLAGETPASAPAGGTGDPRPDAGGGGCQQQATGDSGDSASRPAGDFAVRAVACLAAAADAEGRYRQAKRAASRAANAGTAAALQQLRQLQQLRAKVLAGGSSKLRVAGDRIAGLLDGGEAAAASTDAQCKAQRQLLEGHLRSAGRLACAFDASVHDRSVNAAAAVAMLPAPPPAGAKELGGAEGLASGDDGVYVVGGQWAAVAGSSRVSSHLGRRPTAADAASGGRARTSAAAGSSASTAARAIVEDIWRQFSAATPAAARRR